MGDSRAPPLLIIIFEPFTTAEKMGLFSFNRVV